MDHEVVHLRERASGPRAPFQRARAAAGAGRVLVYEKTLPPRSVAQPGFFCADLLVLFQCDFFA